MEVISVQAGILFNKKAQLNNSAPVYFDLNLAFQDDVEASPL